jgi:hypothetical protein
MEWWSNGVLEIKIRLAAITPIHHYALTPEG